MHMKGAARAALAVAMGSAAAFGEVVRQPLNAGAALEYTQFFDALNYQGTPFRRHPSGSQAPVTMVRPTGWLFQGVTVNERMDLVVGLGATAFSLPSPELLGSGYENEMYPAVALVQASASYAWGAVHDPVLKATFGQVPYKYNPDAKDLGEYLFRSTPYPGTVLNSPFDLVGSARAGLLGGILSKSLAGGRWRNDLIIGSMNWTVPLYDVSLAYVTSFKVNPILELGTGVNFYRLIPSIANATTRNSAGNAYFTYGGGDIYVRSSGDTLRYVSGDDTLSLNGKYSTRTDYYNNRGTGLDSTRALVAADMRNVLSNNGALPSGVSGVDYYTFKGTMLMARASVDLEPALNMGLKVYGEWAWLGARDYPVYFEDPVERMPMMVGVNIPTFGLLDALGVEVQYWKNPWFNSLVEANYNNISPVPDMGSDKYANAGMDPARAVKEDDFRWSVSGTKSFGGPLSVTLKAAQDHPQLMQLMSAGFPGKSYGDVAATRSSWYYVLRLQMAI